MGRISEHDRSMRKRLAVITPLAVLAHLVILFALERVNVIDDIIMIGYEGPPKFEPQISIVDDRVPADAASLLRRRAMVVQDIVIEGEKTPRRAKRAEPSPPLSESRRPEQLSSEIPGAYAFRSYPSRAAVPYREDYIILRMVNPEYPPDALANAEEGYVLIEAYIGTDGLVSEAYVRSSFGPVSFESSSLEAVRQFLFKPMRDREKAIPFWVSFLVRYQLRR